MTQPGKANGNHDRLRGWKEIGEFLRVHPRTIQRWLARGVGVPVYRVGNGKTSLVFADRQELHAWMRSDEGQALSQGDAPDSAASAHFGAPDDEAGEQQADADEGDERPREAAPLATDNGPDGGNEGAPPEAPRPAVAGRDGGFGSGTTSARPLPPPVVAVEGPSGPGTGVAQSPEAVTSPAAPAPRGVLLGRRRRLLPFAAAAVFLIAAAVAVFLLYPRGTSSAATPRGGSGPAPTSYALRLTFEDGTVGSMGIAPGGPATVRVSNRPTIMLVPAPKAGELHLHLYIVEPAQAAHRIVAELGSLRLEPNRPAAAPRETGISFIEWVKSRPAAASKPTLPKTP